MDHIGVRQLAENIVKETRSETRIFKTILARFSVVELLHVPIAFDLGLVAVDTTFHLDIRCKGVFHTVRINVGM